MAIETQEERFRAAETAEFLGIIGGLALTATFVHCINSGSMEDRLKIIEGTQGRKVAIEEAELCLREQPNPVAVVVNDYIFDFGEKSACEDYLEEVYVKK